jgi:preprotein translocase subunit SecA
VFRQAFHRIREKKQYNYDITYGTNNEFGFDYLRDNMAVRLENRVQRGHHYAIIDEVDSVLIDEARTPLIISGPVAKSKNRYKEYRTIVAKLVSRQTVLISDIVARADTLWKQDSIYEAAELYLKAKRGAPKHRRLTKALQDPDILKAIKKVEADRMREKNLHLLDEDLLFSIDERDRSVAISDRGREILSPNDPDFFLLVDIGEHIAELDTMNLDTVEKEKRKRQIYEDHSKKAEALHNIDQLLKAFQMFDKDVEYVVDKDRVIIVDQFTGRLMPGRRFSDGLHEALEAKENVEIRSETQTMASITIQNYFRMYETLAGMTGTAETEAEEFEETYGLDVVVIPTNVPVMREDNDDRVYKTKREKYSAIINQIESLHRRGQPVLVGTVSVEVSEMISKMLKTRKVPHSVLNAKHHQKEAEIITRAGQPGVVTIATNMAGRGTDIKLAEAVLEITDESGENIPGGLFVLGTERHEARRIDRQLRGRSGRQGDPGSSWFYLSLEDDLFRLFASEKVIEFLKNSGDEGETIEHPLLTKAISRAQKRVEQYNYDIRKRLLEYDDVINKQREIIYDLRLKALTGEGFQDEVLEMIGAVANYVIEEIFPDSSESEDWDIPRAQFVLSELAGAPINLKGIDDSVKEADELREKAVEKVIDFYRKKEEKLGTPLLRELEKWAMLRAIDSKWRDHLYDMDQLRGGIGLRSYGQRDPLVEYKKESFGMFETLLDDIDKLSVRQILGLWPQPKGLQRSEVAAGKAYHPSLAGPGKRPAVRTAGQTGGSKQETVRKKEPGVGRNDPCPCGSGKKYKKCCGS